MVFVALPAATAPLTGDFPSFTPKRILPPYNPRAAFKLMHTFSKYGASGGDLAQLGRDGVRPRETGRRLRMPLMDFMNSTGCGVARTR